MQHRELDLNKIPLRFKTDVQCYIDDNKVKMEMAELSPERFLQFWLSWNGLINYDQAILALVKSLQDATNKQFI